MSVFSFLPPDFDERYRGREMLKLPAIPGLDDVFGWDDLNDILNLSLQHPGSLSLVRGGDHLPAAKYLRPSRRGPDGGTQEVVPSAIARSLGEGYSVVLNNMPAYHERVQSLADALTKRLEESVNINAYCSWSEDRCFPTHWDSHDVLIIQVEGRKDWRVFKPTRLHPLDSDAAYDNEPPDEPPHWSGTLEKGEVLYIPRGWWHDAASLPGGSVHLTCGFTNPTGVSLIRYFTDMAARSDRMRGDLPRTVGTEETRQYLSEFRAFINDVCDDDLLEQFWFAHKADLPQRRTNSLPESIALEHFNPANRAFVCSGLAPQIVENGETDEVSIAIGGRTWVFQIACAPILRRLADGAVVDVEFARKSLDTDLESARAFMFELLNEGVICFYNGDRNYALTEEAAE